ncbi:MAG: hypothetical protein HC914_21545 [Chloroflexaceae bacterium]|nr:hypothetical protein [Chloroflexaceae bacterium]
MVLWFGGAFIAHAFLIADPRTHFYTMQVPGALLTALAVVQLWHVVPSRLRPGTRATLLTGAAAVVLLAVPYLSLLYLMQSPEYYRFFPASRPAIYRASYGDTVPGGGHFGFPHRDGWKVAGELYQAGVLQGTYASNQRDRVGGWYTRGAFQCEDNPDAFLLATWDTARLPAEYRQQYYPSACVLVDGMRMLTVFERQPPTDPPRPLLLDAYIADFDRRAVPNFAVQDALLTTVPQHSSGATWQAGITLAGYDLARPTRAPDQPLLLALYWETTTRLSEDITVDVVLVSQHGMIAEEAHIVCTPNPPARWSLVLPNETMHRLTIDAAQPAESYTLRVGLRNSRTNALLPLSDGAEWLMLTVLPVETHEED